MSINRPRNINRRLTGTPNLTTGNAGQIGPVKGPSQSGELALGCQCVNVVCAGVFKVSESNCGVKIGCKSGTINTGGYVICNASNVYWVVAPSSSEVSRSWYTRNDSNTRAQQVTGCTGWFIPCQQRLQNPGYNCRVYWDSYISGEYWTETSAGEYLDNTFPNVCGGPRFAHRYGVTVNMSNGARGAYFGGTANKNNVKNIRSFRCVSY